MQKDLLLMIEEQKKLLKIQSELLLKLKDVNLHLENLLSHDGLTGIPNHRNFDKFIKMNWKNAFREQQPIDVDYFKLYNEIMDIFPEIIV